MTTEQGGMEKLLEELRTRIAEYKFRSDTIYSGAIIVEELSFWLKKFSAIEPPAVAPHMGMAGREDVWKHGAEAMRHAILQQLPGGQFCDPQQIADAIRALSPPEAVSDAMLHAFIMRQLAKLETIDGARSWKNGYGDALNAILRVLAASRAQAPASKG